MITVITFDGSNKKTDICLAGYGELLQGSDKMGNSYPFQRGCKDCLVTCWTTTTNYYQESMRWKGNAVHEKQELKAFK